ncbi:TIGR01244 family sulfur transferase [Brucellaceae bacterium C25G]
MDIRQIDDFYSVSGQISPDDIRDIAAQGFQTLICHRPDGEGGAEQANFAEIAKVAEKVGITTVHIPFSGGMLTQEDVDAMADALAKAEGPVLGFCRSGARSTQIYSIVRGLQNN